MHQNALKELKALRKERGDKEAFSSNEDFLVWSDDVLAILEIDPVKKRTFSNYTNGAKTAFRAKRVDYSAVDECIGIVNQVIKKLELESTETIKQSSNKPSNKEPVAPEKISISWLYKHVPLSFWVTLIGAFIIAFGAGVTFSQTDLYKSLKTETEKVKEKT